MNRRAIPALTIAGLAVAATACSVNTEPDEAAIVYHASMGSATEYSTCYGPAKRESVGAGDNTWTYPAGTRTYAFNGKSGAESKPLEALSKDGVKMTIPGMATFALNTECGTLRTFHERIGLKYGAYLYSTERGEDDNGWKRMLGDYFGTPLDRAIDAATKEYGWEELTTDTGKQRAWEQRIAELAATEIVKTAGAQFFCTPTYVVTDKKADCGRIELTLNTPEPPAELLAKKSAKEGAKLQRETQEEINATVDTQLESMKKLVELLGKDGYVANKAIEEGKDTTVILNNGGTPIVIPKQ